MTSDSTVATLLTQAAAQLASAGVAEPRLEARVLAAAALGLTRERLLAHGDATVAPDAEARLANLVRRRASGEPTARLLGRKEFWSLDFALSAATLIPRPDTETLVEAALAHVDNRNAPFTVLDFGTGTGCILLALLSELPNARGIGVDLDADAVATATRNAASLGLAARAEFRQGCWGEGLDGRFDLIVSNPPYIRDGDIAGLAREVAVHEPRLALAGGADGLDCYRRLAPDLLRLLAPTGAAFLEIGQGQAEDVVAIMTGVGLVERDRNADLQGIPRCLSFGPPPPGGVR